MHPHPLLLFDGQGSTQPSSFPSSHIQSRPLAAIFFRACQEAFVKYWDALSADEQALGELPHGPCCIPTTDAQLLMNPLVAVTNLYLIQVLHYLTALQDDHNIFTSPNLKIVGYSSGILPATAVASSDSIPTLLANFLDLFGLVFWLGYRCQCYRREALNALPPHDIDRESQWSLVLFGMNKEMVQLAVDKFNAEATNSKVYVTATTTESCISVSGFPTAITQFRKHYIPESCPTRFANIFTLYHAPHLRNIIKPTVLADLSRHKCQVHLFLKRPLYSTFSGVTLPLETPPETLIDLTLDMILSHPVNFDLVSRNISADASLANSESMRIINIGPGASLARSLSRSLAGSIPEIGVVDLSADDSSLRPQDSLLEQPPSAHEPIAIIGMAVNFPGAEDATELWTVLEQGLNTVSEIPKTRFDVSQYTHAPAGASRALKTRFGNFIDSPDAFDNTFFRISPREARSMDPQQRVLLRIAFHALESSGYVPHATQSFDPDTFGCYVGVATNDYVQNLRNDVDVHYSTGTLPAFLSGRISYALGLSGPSIVVNTACSSSAVALYQACRALAAGDCTAALAGGVNVITSPDMYLGLDRAHFLSPTGQCKPFDESADGYCRSDGCGMFVLKRLSDALAESDNILGVIRGVEVNQSAAAHSITHPHAPTQTRLFEKLLTKSGVDAQDISVVEAHGTGTQAGDPVELRSLRSALNKGRTLANPLHITSIKANIGHAEAASGAAGLAKLLLMLRNRVIPAQISLQKLNPKIADLAADGTCIDVVAAPWDVREGKRRIALLNNFGAAGSNATLLVEEAPPRRLTYPVVGVDEKDTVLVAFSAETEVALLKLRDSYMLHADVIGDSKTALVDFAYTVTARRQIRPWRMAVAADSTIALRKLLHDARPTKCAQTSASGKTVFVFSGQGGQHLGMGRSLYAASRVFRGAVDACHRKLVSWGYPGVLAVIDAAVATQFDDKAVELQVFQCSIFVLEYALLQLWISWGAKPDAVAGHSLGEYAALVAAGVITLDAALRLVAFRARLMADKCSLETSSMLAVRLAPKDAADALEGLDGCSGLSIACFNSSADVVIGGPLDQLATLKSHLEENVGCKCVSVNVPFAYHTEAMEPILEDLTGYAAKFELSAPQIPIVSNVCGTLVYPGDESVFDHSYFARHCRQPVRFEEGVNELFTGLGPIGVCIELGPHPTTLPMLSQANVSSGANAVMLHSLHKKASAPSSLASTLAHLYSVNSGIAWRRVYEELYPSAHCVDAPAYPLSEASYWVQFREEEVHQAAEASSQTRFAFLGAWTQKPSTHDGNISEFETPISRLASFISGHRVSSFPLCPASVYHELALAAATYTLKYFDDSVCSEVLTLSDVQFTHPLVYDPDVAATLRTTINLHPPNGKHAGTFNIASFHDGNEVGHCTGFFQRRSNASTVAKLQLHRGALGRRKASVLQPSEESPPETLRTRTIYDHVFSRVVQYSKPFQVIQSMTLDGEGEEAFATIKLPEDHDQGPFVVQPVFVDALLHAAGFIINRSAQGDTAYICSQVDSVKVLSDILDYSATYDVFCNTATPQDGLVLADAWAVESSGAKRVVAHLKRMRFSKLRLNSLHKLLSCSGKAAEKAVPHQQALTSVSTPKPPTRTRTQSSSSTMTLVDGSLDISHIVLKLVSEVCRVPPEDVSLHSDIADLGIDSLMWIELIGLLQSYFPSVAFDSSQIMLSRIVGELIGKLAQHGDLHLALDTDEKGIRIDTVHAHLKLSKPAMTSPAQVREVFSKVLEIPAHDLHDDDTFDQLGLDSLASIEALHGLQAQFPVSLPINFFHSHPTVGAVEAFICNATISSPTSSSNCAKQDGCDPLAKLNGLHKPLLKIQSKTTSACPLFLVHDGSGLSYGYSRISDLGRSVWSISNPKLLCGDRWEGGIPEMSNYYVEQIAPFISDAGCILGGWSFGGVIAFHMACELVRSGVKVAGVVLIDSPSPFTRNALPDALIDVVIQASDQPLTSQQSTIIDLARIQMRHSTRALVQYDACVNQPTYPNLVMLRCTKGFDVQGIPGCDPMPFLEDRSDPKSAVVDWERLVGREVPVLDIPGNHFEPFHAPHLATLSKQLNNAIALLERSNS